MERWGDHVDVVMLEVVIKHIAVIGATPMRGSSFASSMWKSKLNGTNVTS